MLLQFNYGEDSLDILKTRYFKSSQFPFLVQNKQAIISEKTMSNIRSKVDTKAAYKYVKKVGM